MASRCLPSIAGSRGPRYCSRRSWSHATSWAQIAPAVEPGLRLRLGRNRLGTPRAFSSSKRELPTNGAPPFAFAFDIDGVLLHVAKPIPGATDTLRYLNAHNIPFILLTNGGGRREADRVAELSKLLDVPLDEQSFVQSHTPFQELVDGPNGLGDKHILVTGANAENCRRIAEHYGFQSVITPADILAAEPQLFPFDPLLKERYAAAARPLPVPIFRPGKGAERPSPSTALQIAAMFVYNDPRDWAVDIQIITDLLLSEEGYLGTFSSRNGDVSLPNAGWQQHSQPTLFYSNSDLLWSTGYHLPRFGQGAFQGAVAGAWQRVTGGVPLQAKAIGKPKGETYRYAENVLRQHRHKIFASQGHGGAPGQLTTVYMVGDNPESDIAGCNGYSGHGGTAWHGVLVRTGVWTPDRGGEKALQGQFRPSTIVDDVRGAVRWALEREGWKGEGVL